ncbi:MAG: hypothetical protein ACR2FH_07445 [Caulobacteraceae bacterium]
MDRDLATTADLAANEGEGQSAVSWSAVFAGAAAALALSFVLVALAAGFGLKLASPWPGGRGGAGEFTPLLGAGLIAVQVISGALGGYLAGRLRTRWTHAHGHEVHFRDTAHGLLVWAVSALAGVVLAATVLAPLAEPAATTLAAVREANLAAQAALFMGIGLLLSAFTASVAAAIGGMRRDEMHGRFWSERVRAEPPARL